MALVLILLALQEPEPIFELTGPPDVADRELGGWLPPLDAAVGAGDDSVPIPRVLPFEGPVPAEFEDLLVLVRGGTIEAWSIAGRRRLWSRPREEFAYVGLLRDFGGIRRVYPDSPAARASLHVGERGSDLPWARSRVDRPAVVQVESSAGRREVTIVPEPVPPDQRRRFAGPSWLDSGLYVGPRLVLVGEIGVLVLDPATGAEFWSAGGGISVRDGLALCTGYPDISLVDLTTGRDRWRSPASWDRDAVCTSAGLLVRDGDHSFWVDPATGGVRADFTGSANLVAVLEGDPPLLLLRSTSRRCWVRRREEASRGLVTRPWRVQPQVDPCPTACTFWYAFDPSTRQFAWTYATRHPLSTAHAAGPAVALWDAERGVDVVDPRTGATLFSVWGARLGVRPLGAGWILFTTEDAPVRVAHVGLRREVTVDPPIHDVAETLVLDGRLLLLGRDPRTDHSTLCAIDADGREAWRADVGPQPPLRGFCSGLRRIDGRRLLVYAGTDGDNPARVTVLDVASGRSIHEFDYEFLCVTSGSSGRYYFAVQVQGPYLALTTRNRTQGVRLPEEP